jgi:hypothetical protein
MASQPRSQFNIFTDAKGQGIIQIFLISKLKGDKFKFNSLRPKAKRIFF